jgi:hypothetical protein
MKTFLRMALLLGIVGASYLFGRWQAAATPTVDIKPISAAQIKKVAASKTLKSKGPYFVTLDDIRRLFANPDISWDDKEDYFRKVLLPGIDPRDLPDVIKLMAGWPVPRHAVSDKNYMLLVLFQNLALANPEAALALLLDFPQGDNQDRSKMIGVMLGNLAASDPQQAFSLLAQYYPGDFDQPRAYYFLFGFWVQKNPADAAAAALNFPPGFTRKVTLTMVAGAWGMADPQAAIKWAQGLPAADANVLNQVLYEALQTSAQSGAFDKQITLNQINQINDLSERNDLIDGVGVGLKVGGNATAAVDWLNQNSSGVAYDEAINNMFSYLGNTSPTTMVPALEKITDPGVLATAIGDLATQWGNSSPADALAWAQTLPDADAAARTGAIDTILTSLSKTNPNAAAAFVENAADPSAYLSAAPAIAQNLAATDPDAALDWASNLPDGTGKDQAIGNVLASMAQIDPTEAWDYATSLPTGSDQDTVMNSIVTATAQKDPALAATLAEEIPAGSAQVSAISSVSATWVAQDPQTFTIWLNGLPEGDQRDAAVAQLVSSTQTTKDPADVLQWANTVDDPQARASEIATVITAWAGQDPAAALSAAQTANLTDAQRAALVQKITQASGNKQ